MERGDKIRRGQTDGRYSVKARIPILSFLLLTLIFSCKTVAQSDSKSGVKSPVPAATGAPEGVPVVETQISESSEPEGIVEAVDTAGIAEEVPPGSDIDVEDESEDVFIEDEPAVEPEAAVIEEAQESHVQAEEESVPLPAPPPVEPQVVQPPAPPAPPPATSSPVQPPVQNQVPAQPPAPPVQPQTPATPPPAAPPPAQQSQVPTTPRDPPLPPSFLGPAEPERTPPARQEVPPPALPELPSLPRNETPETPIVFSRVVRMTVGQLLEIPFQGTGWVYLGEIGNRSGLSYDSRRVDTERGITLGQSFIFRADATGTYILKFYRQDFIQDYIINDYVQVIVGEADNSARGRTGSIIDQGRVVAEPRWPVIPGAAGSSSETVSPPTGATSGAPATGAQAGTTAETQRPNSVQAAEPASPTVSGSPPATSAPSQAAASPPAEVIPPGTSAERAGASEGSPPDEYVRRAKQEFDAGRVEQALAIIEQMRQRYPTGTDEAWWLLGQLYEANSPARDIRQSLECYRTLINEYPQSNRVDDARRRIAYLERYYLNIR